MPIPTTFVSLGDLLAEGFSKSRIRKAFSRFECERDADVAFFLKAHAIQNEGLRPHSRRRGGPDAPRS